MSNFGVWAMIAFWASAIGGIALAIAWARGRSRNPVDAATLARLLRERLERGEIEPEEYQRRLQALRASEGPDPSSGDRPRDPRP